MFPADNVWNTPIDSLPVDPRSDAYVGTIGAGRTFHPDFGTVWQGAPNGIPYTLVPGDQPRVRVSFSYADESDSGPYPIPADAPIEGGPSSNGDRHVLLVDTGKCMLYELYAAYAQTDGSWKAGSGAIYDLNANKLRPSSWTSADAAGLPMLPGLVRFDEVDAGAINHALRFTAPLTQRAFVWPARHYASSNRDTSVPPMGERFRLKADFDISSYPPQIQVIFSALKTYGMMLADNGSPWYVSGAPDPRWDDDMLVRSFRSLHGSDFEAVDASSLMVDPSSAAAAFPG
ncbi:MAG TPA: hypothetical protein VGK54_16130 [Chloroflexota bacterium]